MCDQSLEIIKTRAIFLDEGVLSSEIVLIDEVEGNMYFTFQLRYMGDGDVGNTVFQSTDPFHATVTIDTLPHSLTRFSEPMEIGTYHKTKKLYLHVVVEPAQVERQHSVTISFLTNKN